MFLVKHDLYLLVRCAPRGLLTPGVGFNRVAFLPSRTRYHPTNFRIINLVQGQCGSCAAFATVAILETWWAISMCIMSQFTCWYRMRIFLFWNNLTPPPPPSFWQQRGVMFDDLSEQHIVSVSPVFIFINLAVYYNHQWYVTRFCSSFDILRCWIWKAIVLKYYRDWNLRNNQLH